MKVNEQYKDSKAVIEYKDGGFGFRGSIIDQKDHEQSVKFTAWLGDEVFPPDEDGNVYTGDTAGRITIEVHPNCFDLNIATAGKDILEMCQMDNRTLKNLRDFLNYAVDNIIVEGAEPRKQYDK